MASGSTRSRSVLITGASSGLGLACAVELDRLGWHVFAGVRREEDGQALVKQASNRLTPVMLDVTDTASIAAAAAQIEGTVGQVGLDGLVNNAGIGVAGPLETIPLERMRLQLEVNVLGPVAVTQAVLPLLRKARGRLVNMSSVSGRLAIPCLGPYCASKFALEALSDSLRVELSRWGIAVCLVEPASVVSKIWDKALADIERLEAGLSPEHRELYGDVFEGMKKGTVHQAETALPVQRVVRAVVHALTARWPKPRYLVVPRPAIVFRMFRALPDRLRDRAIRAAIAIAKKTKLGTAEPADRDIQPTP
ncbi:MAG: SDR family oxidoreductase [Pirellulales bacterium]|nr:SDR family oxidoreductase [Pirellulales bacterium]